MTMNKSFYNFEKIEAGGQKIVFLFSPSSYDEPCYEARQLSHNASGIGEERPRYEAQMLINR